MAPRRNRNPIGFTPWPVTFFTITVIGGILAVLVTLHNHVPSAPSNPTPVKGLNLTEAWHDLQVLTSGYHPYNSRKNDEIRNWLLLRIEEILQRNNLTFATESKKKNGDTKDDARAVVFKDITSNLTFSSGGGSTLGVAYTGLNVIVYLRGSDDEPGKFWEKSESPKRSGVLVNAHYDSVPSGYGATDDGVGVISILQLISYFSTRQPKRGIVFLLNNGEEDYLNGAYAFTQHPLSRFPHTFLNLEGAGAGGRAALFRSTDTEVTRAYKKVPYPFGTVISADGFKRGLVRSETDYIIFDGILGMRGLDVAFMEPRARYHTQEDSTRYTSRDSVWHMLSAAQGVTEQLANDESDRFDGEPLEKGKVASGTRTDAVWFDLFGRAFVVFELHTLFAISVTLLVVTPLVLIGMTALISHLDKWYPFSINKKLHADEVVRIGGLRAFFRTPFALAITTTALAGLAYLVTKINPYIIYSSEYSVWRYVHSTSTKLTSADKT